MTVKIAFIGKAGSGKTTLADEICACIPHMNVACISFAYALKRFAEAILMRTIDKHDVADRAFLQYLSGARGMDENIWVKHLSNLYETVKHLDCVVVDDCRYLNEAAWLRLNGFMLVRVVGRGANLPPSLTEHQSETEQDSIKVDFTVVNVGSPRDVVLQVLAAYRRWEWRV